MTIRRRPQGGDLPSPGAHPVLSRRQLLSGGLAATAALAGCGDRFDASTWFSRGRYDVDRRFRESIDELGPPIGPSLWQEERFSVLMISDMHFFEQEPNRSVTQIAEYLRDDPVDLIFELGDLADAGWSIEYESALLALESLGLPVYGALGNHDVWNNGWTQFRLHFGASVYTLTVGQVLFVVTDTAGGTLGGLQRPWLEEQLAAGVEQGHRIILLGHYPLWTTAEVGFGQMGSQQEVYDILDLARRYQVTAHISGHTHRWAYTEVEGTKLYTVSAQKEASPDRSALRLDVDGGEITFTRVEFPHLEEL